MYDPTYLDIRGGKDCTCVCVFIYISKCQDMCFVEDIKVKGQLENGGGI